MSSVSIGLVGAGAVGTTLAVALSRAGYNIAAVSSRRWETARALATRLNQGAAAVSPVQVVQRCDVVFITTPDGAIGQVVSQLPWRRGQGVAHCSGVHTLDVLAPAQAAAADTGSFHPLYTFPRGRDKEQPATLPRGVTFAIEGEGWLRKLLEEMALSLGGKPVNINPHYRSLYHASAAMACGYLVAQLKAATDMWDGMGLTRQEALQALLPLARATLENVARLGLEESLTGPTARGDVATVRAHLDSLACSVPDVIPLYSWLGLHSLELARSRMKGKDLERMTTLLRDALYHSQGGNHDKG